MPNTYLDIACDGDDYVVVETGQPQDPVRIGVGSTFAKAYASLQATPIQSAGSDCGLDAALRWAHGAGWVSSSDLNFVSVVLSEDDLAEWTKR